MLLYRVVAFVELTIPLVEAPDSGDKKTALQITRTSEFSNSRVPVVPSNSIRIPRMAQPCGTSNETVFPRIVAPGEFIAWILLCLTQAASHLSEIHAVIILDWIILFDGCVEKVLWFEILVIDLLAFDDQARLAE
jgi:hypothetical protein